MEDRISVAVNMLQMQLKEGESIAVTAECNPASIAGAEDLLTRWQERTIELIGLHVSRHEAERFKSLGVSYYQGIYFSVPLRARSYCDRLRALLTEVMNHPDNVFRVDPPTPPPPLPVSSVPSTDIFIVHGRDSGAAAQVARFLEHLQLHPVILHEQPGMGRTLIEKFESHASGVGYAVVLLTPDDVGSLKGESVSRSRARQNVIFELGYFLGLVGRSRVTALYWEGVELLTDYQGVQYIPFDDKGAWRTSLAIELKAAGLPVDPSNLL